jgi:N-acetylmuramoyl-L-alanine amidase
MNFKKRTSTEYLIIYRSNTGTKNVGKQDIDRACRAAGSLGIGYHYVIRRDGLVEPGRQQDVVGAHDSEYNHNSIALCVVGDQDNETIEQEKAVAGLIKTLQAEYSDLKIVVK